MWICIAREELGFTLHFIPFQVTGLAPAIFSVLPLIDTVAIFMQVNVSCDVVIDPKTKLVLREFCGLDFLSQGEHRGSLLLSWLLLVSLKHFFQASNNERYIV